MQKIKTHRYFASCAWERFFFFFPFSFENGPEFKRMNGYSESNRNLDSPSWVIQAVKAWNIYN